MVPDAYIGATEVDDVVLPGEKGDNDTGRTADRTGRTAAPAPAAAVENGTLAFSSWPVAVAEEMRSKVAAAVNLSSLPHLHFHCFVKVHKRVAIISKTAAKHSKVTCKNVNEI